MPPTRSANAAPVSSSAVSPFTRRATNAAAINGSLKRTLNDLREQTSRRFTIEVAAVEKVGDGHFGTGTLQPGFGARFARK